MPAGTALCMVAMACTHLLSKPPQVETVVSDVVLKCRSHIRQYYAAEQALRGFSVISCFVPVAPFLFCLVLVRRCGSAGYRHVRRGTGRQRPLLSLSCLSFCVPKLQHSTATARTVESFFNAHRCMTFNAPRCMTAQRTTSARYGGQRLSAIMPAIAAANPTSHLPPLTLEAFKGEFNIASLIDKIALPVLEQHGQLKGVAASGKPEFSVQQSMQAAQQLSEQFERSVSKQFLWIRLIAPAENKLYTSRVDKDLRRLQLQLEQQMQRLHRSVEAAEGDYQVSLGT